MIAQKRTVEQNIRKYQMQVINTKEKGGCAKTSNKHSLYNFKYKTLRTLLDLSMSHVKTVPEVKNDYSQS